MGTEKYLILILFVSIFCSCLRSEPEINIDNNNISSFHGIKISNDGSEFYPSNYGGIAVIINGRIFYPWSVDVKNKMVKLIVKQNFISAEWIMFKPNDFYYHYKMEISQKLSTLQFHIEDLGKIKSDTMPKDYADVFAVYLDRCEDAIKPVIVGVPYLTTFNILFANDCFVSMYFDWNKTNCSQIIAYNQIYSNTSVYYSQYAQYNSLTNGKRNKLDETIYLKVSQNIDNVLPDLPNPVSKYKDESSKRIVFDDWGSFDKSISKISEIKQNGMDHIWHIVHMWQKYGYDVALPDIFPANNLYGGNDEIVRISKYDSQSGFLFALHENYMDMYTRSSMYDPKFLALNSNGKYIFNWYNSYSGDTAYLVKSTRIFENLIPMSKQIKETFNISSVYHDVSASYDPSKYVDYDDSVENAGKFTGPFNIYKNLADTLREINQGPVSSEGLAHFLYVGFYDDICAQIHTAQSLPGSYGTEKLGGFYKPLLVSFDLLKMKEKAAVHGVGYYERFFYKDNYWDFMGRSKDSALIYAATELAYGHAAFFSTSSYNFIEQGLIEYNYVYPIQLKYADSKAVKILYNDNDKFLTASDYIRKYPLTFANIENANFMSQVYIEYENGLKIFVNRNPWKDWVINLDNQYGFYSLHCFINGKDSLETREMKGNNFKLPNSNGWVCFMPK